ncbi:TolC family protein [Silvibacterium dinghuense]|uniref:TolC family protein n=1 Tax=Silvibacterium dinghuense TaxID=1560006 RepID=UPI0019A01F8A|nr:TolC family protein [Silvibacterium dinghuense]GGG94686.1 transporter [Silvibacterium dinghuense]
MCSALAAGVLALAPVGAYAFQLGGGSSSGVAQPAAPIQVQQPVINSSTFQGSETTDKATDGVLDLTLADAIARGLKHNLGLILTSQSTLSSRGSQLEQLQSLLPTVTGKITESVQQTDLQALGLRGEGFPAIIGPYGYTDLRASLKWSLLDLSSLQNYLASKHNFAASKLSAADARDMVVLTVGNAYLLCIADKSRIDSVQAQVDTSKVSLDQAVSNHQAGTAPLLDELRARVDYQTQEQTLISTKNTYEKDKIALARAIGLPLEQKFELTDQEPYAALDPVDADAAVKQALGARQDLAAAQEQQTAAEQARHAATYERLPVISFSGDYGAIGVNVGNSRSTFDATGSLDIPIFEEAKLRGDAQSAQSQLNQAKAKLSDKQGQIGADVRDSLLDMESAAKQVEVARSNVELAKEALSEAQQRYKAGVSDNLAVSQALQAMAQADDQYVSSLYQHNVAKLSLARALGVADQKYQVYLGGK